MQSWHIQRRRTIDERIEIIGNPIGVGVTEQRDPLHFEIRTTKREQMQITRAGAFINGGQATPDEVVAFLKRLAERNAKDALM